METSEKIIEISKALLKFQGLVQKIKKTSTNPFFKSKYAALPEILEAIAEPLKESNLVFSQHPDGDSLTTILIHVESGEYFKSTFNINAVKKDPQSIGSGITYSRRYSLVSILGLNVDDDDDGNLATNKTVDVPKVDVNMKRLEDCKTLEELKKVYTSLQKNEQTRLLNKKDQLKLVLPE